MKRILITICTLFACVMLSVAQGDSYKITGQVGNSVNGKLLLVALTEKGLIDIGEAEVTNGVFEFTGRMSETTLAYLMPVQRNAALATIMLENANYTITAGANELIDRGWRRGVSTNIERVQRFGQISGTKRAATASAS